MAEVIPMITKTERIHVYMLPLKRDIGYCFGGGNQINFTNQDWFDADPSPEHRLMLVAYVKGKRYYTMQRDFLILGETFAELLPGITVVA